MTQAMVSVLGLIYWAAFPFVTLANIIALILDAPYRRRLKSQGEPLFKITRGS